MLGNDPALPARRVYFKPTDPDYEKKKEEEEKREPQRVISHPLFSHAYRIVLNKWRFDWKTARFPWGFKEYSMCYIPAFELLDAPLKNRMDADTETWNRGECCTVKEFGNISPNYLFNPIILLITSLLFQIPMRRPSWLFQTGINIRRSWSPNLYLDLIEFVNVIIVFLTKGTAKVSKKNVQTVDFGPLILKKDKNWLSNEISKVLNPIIECNLLHE